AYPGGNAARRAIQAARQGYAECLRPRARRPPRHCRRRRSQEALEGTEASARRAVENAASAGRRIRSPRDGREAVLRAREGHLWLAFRRWTSGGGPAPTRERSSSSWT